MDERKVVDYFVVAGLPSDMQPVNEFSIDGAHLKSTHSQAPITDITVIFPSLGEGIPEGYTLIQYTPTGILADLNHGSLRSPEVFLCYRRGRDKPPLVDIGVMHEGKEYILPDSEVVRETLTKKCANVNNSAAKTFLTYRRAQSSMPCNSLVVTDIAVIITSKGETAPHAFCMIKKNLNKGLVGSDVYLCYKKSMNRANLITYKPGILLRYPFDDHSNLPLPTTVPMFCLPMGCSLEKWPITAQQPAPLVSTFVLTVSDAAEKLYGSAVTFYERYPAESLTPEQKQALGSSDDSEDQWTYNINKCICLLSRWPFFDTYEKFLLFLHEISCSNEPQPVPIERFITYFLEDVPFPSPQRPRIFVQLSVSYRVILTQPEDLPLPRSGASFRQLLMNLGPENCLAILLCALTEQKMLVHSLRPDVLTSVAEAISTIMFPFKWQCPYIPLCPLGLAEVLHAPLPFLIGVDSRFFDLYDPPTDVSCVDLDTNNITLCEEKKNLSTKILPKKACRALKSTLELLYKKLLLFIQQVMSKEEETVADNDSIDKEFQIKKKEQALELEIQEAFIRFMANVLKGYRSYLLPITKAPTVGTTDTNSLFDLQGFLRSRDKAHFKFFSLVTKTQMFIRFIEERSFVSDMDASLAFFDECTEKVDNEDESVHLLEVDESHYSERTVFIMPPETTGQTYIYEGFTLNPKLLSHSDKRNNTLDTGKTKGPGGRLSGSGIAPGSPMARRTKHEIKLSQRIARQCSASPNLWAKCLVGTCFSIWFIHLPSYVLTTQNPPATLRYAYDLLVKIHKSNILPTDEVCYRVMMQLCGAYSQPVVAVKLLFHMKRAGLQPNAITYGFYNRAVLEATWPSGMSNSSQLLWNKLRNVIKGAALFKKAGITAGKRRLSVTAEENSTLFDPVANSGSRTSIDSSESLYQKINDVLKEEDSVGNDASSRRNVEKTGEVITECENNVTNCEGFAVFDKFRSCRGSIVRPAVLPLLNPSSTFKQPPFESSAGLLITGVGGPLKEESLEIDQLDSPAGVPPLNRRYYRSGSCSEFTHNPLRHTPTSPKPSSNDNSYKMLIRSESFANDAGILEKLHSLKIEMPQTTRSGDSLKPKSVRNVSKNGQSNLANRRGSLNLRKMKEFSMAISDSCESSTENLGSLGGGSVEEINGVITPKRHKILNPFGSRLQKTSSENVNMKNGPTKFGHMTQVKSDSNLNRSPVKSPSRTPVTENDPLGALLADENYEEETNIKCEVPRTKSEIELDQSGNPVLFDRRLGDWGSFVRSATFTNQEDSEEETEPRTKSLHRSSTMPAENPPVQSAFTNFKLPFTPSSLTSKKSNELLMGGLSSLKSAANSVAKKFDEIKEAISANSTPVKAGSQRSTLERDACLYEDESEYGDEVTSGRRKISSEFSPMNIGQHPDISWGSNIMDWFSDGSRKGSTTNLVGESGPWASQLCIHLPKQQRDPSTPIALQVTMTTCSKCHNCSCILYDEEIMAGWIPEDSNLNTKCQFCDKATVPLLSVTVTDFRNSPMPSVESERKISTASLGSNKTSLLENSFNGSKDKSEPETCEPITVPYLNPLVLRKEFESILAAEGDSCLTQSKFVDEHPIIYWNMVWTFTRIGVESHLPGLALGSAIVSANPDPSWESANSSNVLISTMWHNARLHDEVGQPMYISWNDDKEQSTLVSALVTDRTSVPKSVMQKVISCLQCCNLSEPLKFLAVERQKLKGRGHSLYREILFLGITALGKENIDQAAYDREYIAAYDKLPNDKDPKLYLKCDQPPSTASMFCRQYFRSLEL
ncbi:DENN domain-containing protein Crag isoform X3 [Halyomorpha halys]|uniref:DENN domain-containing protein Crag isoform X3 n=1 Tax=Halyomorpha halys TaxID=286706 RepID=UPI0006D4FBB9|nr:DENN domain-containing protein 4C isoform X3 [Halyomorpha halys]